MDCKTTSTRSRFRRKSAGVTLAETTMSVGVASLVLIAIASISMVSGRSFVAFANSVDLNSANRIAMDTLTRDVRECERVSSFTETQLVIRDTAGLDVTYSFDANRRTLTRTRNGVSKTLLSGCESLQFRIAQRNPVNGSYDVYPTASASDAKVVNVSWNCSRSILGHRANTENVQTARIVIRRQG